MEAPIYGGAIESFDEYHRQADRLAREAYQIGVSRSLVHNYGSEFHRVLDYTRKDKSLGEKIDAKVTAIEPKSRKISLSIKQREVEEEKQAMADYGSAESGASLGDILGAAISKAAKDKEESEKPEE